MTSTSYWFGSWVSTDGDELGPGQAHYWVFWGFNYGDVVYVSAHAVAGDPNAAQRILAVEDLRVEADASGRRLYFTIRNVGPEWIIGYGMGFSMVSQ